MASATLQAMVAPRIIFAVALGISGEQISPTVSNANTWPKKVGGKCCISFSAIRRISPVRFTAVVIQNTPTNSQTVELV